MTRSSVARFAWAVLAWNVAVILWGAYVRASGSGAGCGSHWPLCNGEVLPRAAATATLIEFSHRLTSGIALLSVIALLVAAYRVTRPGDPARKPAVLSVLFILSEAAVGAGLVLFRLVADNATMARALFMGAHLVNTFVLIASLTLAARWLSSPTGLSFSGKGTTTAGLGAVFAGLLLTGVSGAIAALGDTLYPSGSLREALHTDLSRTGHVLVQLRVLHPALAIGTAVLVTAVAARIPRFEPDTRTPARWTMALAAGQVAAGFVNVVLLAPIWMQLVHLLIADCLWIAVVLLAASALARQPHVPARNRPPLHTA